MKYRVFWSPHAENRLEVLLQDLSARPQLAKAAREIDRNLSIDPVGFGETRYENVRVGFSTPLGIQYEVLGDVSSVIVYDVWRIDKRKTE